MMSAAIELEVPMRSCVRPWHGFLAAAFLSTAGAADFTFPGGVITVPDGFEVELAAASPLVSRPIAADFDERGRLFVADSSGSSEKGEKQLQERSHRILLLEDTDGDGRFDKSTVFADRMMFPEGAMWFDGSLYVAAPPSIWKLTDTDGDGVADKREEWFQGKTLTGCANDLHGPYLGPDGWIYWAKGAFAKQTYPREKGPPLVTKAAHFFRSRPDGSGIEPVMTGGMDNPVELVFTAGGERIFTTTFFQHPEAGRRDGLIHAIYGGVYGKQQDALEGHKRTGELMPVLVHFGAAAPCGLACYGSSVFGPEFKGNLFAALFNLHKVTRHVLEPEGATYRTRDSDFVTSTSPDFHPTDVVEDADGSLLLVDTGGWYKICCPTSQLAKPDVLGAVYRIRRKGAARPDDPRGLKLPWSRFGAAELVKLLEDQRPAVRARAIGALPRSAEGAVPLLAALLERRTAELAEARRSAVWALTRFEGGPARLAARKALEDPDPTVCQAAIHSAALHRDHAPALTGLLQSPSLHLRRAAAEALGRGGDPLSVPGLLKAAGEPSDRVLEHSLLYALIEIDRPAETALGLEGRGQKRAALIALDQMEGGGLQASQVTPLLVSPDPELKRTGSWLIGHHPEWAGELAGFLSKRLRSPPAKGEERAELERQLSLFAGHAVVQELLSSTLRSAEAPEASRSLALHAMAQARLKEPPPSWLADLASLIAERRPEVLPEAVATARALSGSKQARPELTAALLRVAGDGKEAAQVRLDALAAAQPALSALEPEIFSFLLAEVEPEKPVAIRGTAAAVLSKAKLSREQLLELLERLKAVGPLEASKLLAAFEGSSEEGLGFKLISALKESSGLAGVRPETLKPILAKFPGAVQRQGEELLSLLDLDATKQSAHLDDLMGKLKDGDLRRGQAIFNSAKAACSACHAIGYLGGKVGPDLTTIGQIRNDRDLLESIVYPSASFVRSYEPLVVVTRTGQVHSGVLKKDSADEVVLATGPATEVRIARADITDMQPGAVSVMPQGLDQQLTTQELADLLAFLKATRW
jgi:putative membrane-bound dehydrogenase-like protein